jgi:hypothetical protein
MWPSETPASFGGANCPNALTAPRIARTGARRTFMSGYFIRLEKVMEQIAAMG